MKNQITPILAAALLVFGAAACGDDAGSKGSGGGNATTNSSTSGNSDTNSAPAGPANEVDASVSGGSSEGTISGTSETSEMGAYYGYVAEGILYVTLTSADAQVITFQADTAGRMLPGSIPVSRDLLSDAHVSLNIGTDIYEGASGNITVSQCPNEVGAVVTGTFDDVGLVNVVTESPDGTLTGDWRVTIQTSDESIACTETAPTNNTDPNAQTNTCNLDTCDGPCCPYLEDLTTCQLNCFDNECMTDPFACGTCLDSCPADVGITEDAACSPLFDDVTQCDLDNGCGEFAGTDQYDTCMASNCCSELQAAY